MEAKERRQRFGRHCRTSIYAAHSRGVAATDSAERVVVVLDLRDQLARDLAETIETRDQLVKQHSRSRNSTPKLIVPMSQVDAAALLKSRSEKAAKMLASPVKASRFRAVIIGYGGMTCTDLPTDLPSTESSFKTKRKSANVRCQE